MSAPACIWACDGETPYFYEDGEDRPATAVRYVRSDVYADVLHELDRERALVRRETLEGGSKSLRIANEIREHINEILGRYDVHSDAYEADTDIDAACITIADSALKIAAD